MDEERLAGLLDRLQRIDDYNEISNQMSQFSHLYAAFDSEGILSLFADRPDTKAEMTWGTYHGFEGVKRCFSFQNPLFTDRLGQKGELHLRPLGAPIITIAKDRKTACGAWICTGTDTQKTNDGVQAYWLWNHYGVNFIRTDSGWKIWRLHEYNVCRSRFETQWTQDAPYDIYKQCGTTQADYFALRDPAIPDEPPSSVYRYNIEELFPVNRPAVPMPYETFTLRQSF